MLREGTVQPREVVQAGRRLREQKPAAVGGALGRGKDGAVREMMWKKN